MAMAGSEEETTALLPTASTSTAGNVSSRSTGGLLRNRYLVIVFLTAVVAVSVYFQYEVNDLTKQLESEHTKVDDLTKVLNGHQEVIDRFNASVTNTDVLSRLSSLESNLDTTNHKLQKELKSVQVSVSQELEETLQRLNATVGQAEQDISNEVEKVKKDVEQYVITTQDQFSMENSFMVYQLAGTFTLLSCLISMWHMTAHLRRMNQPDVQRRILSILWMSPIYAITSWLSLVFPQAEGYLAIIKDGYEAYIIYQFLGFCIAVLGKGDRNTVVDLLARRADHLTPPFRLFGCFEICGCCKPEPYESDRALADAILLQCQFFAMQFVFFRPVTTAAMVVLNKMQYYGAGDGPTDYRSPQFWITIVQNVSIFVAFAGLLKFYHAVDKDLAWCRPFAKFLCIKGVVFMTFWQGLAISILAQTTDMGGKNDDQAEEWAKSAQNFLICLEMLLFSIAHFYCFPTEEWEPGYRVKHSQGQFGDSIALGDFFQDLKLILRSNSYSKKKKKKKNHSTVVEGDGDDETDVLSTTMSEITEEDEKLVANAIRVSLADADDNPDIAEAKERLLGNKLLQSGEISNGDGDAANEQGDIERGTSGDSERHASESSLGSETDRQEVPTETTGLLSGENGTSFMEVLRPSIFTTVASISEIEKHRDASMREIEKRRKESPKQDHDD